MKCNDKKGAGKIKNFLRSTKTNSPTGKSGATNFSPIGHSFMSIETSADNHGSNVYLSFERTDIIQMSNIKICCNGFWAESSKSIGSFRVQPLLVYNIWSTR